MARNNKWLVG